MPSPRPRTDRLREATKRQIVGVLTDTTNSTTAFSPNSNNAVSSVKQVPTQNQVDGTNERHIQMLIEDMQNALNKQLASIKMISVECQQDQLQAYASALMKIPKTIRQLSVAEFNDKYKCNMLDILKTARSSTAITDKAPPAKTTAMTAAACGKRERGLETPAPYRNSRPMTTPTTAVRTVRKGEFLYSKNGSPVDPVDEGALIATVTKKRRGNDPSVADIEGASFDVHVGEGRYISLNDPSAAQNLNEEMKTSALSQLKVLQDQMASLMQKLTTK